MPSEPTNKELGKELRGLDMRVDSLENWRDRQELYKQVLADVKAQDVKDQKEQRVSDIQSKKAELYKQALIIAGIIVTMLSAYAATRGN
jgi:hypothetical protein